MKFFVWLVKKTELLSALSIRLVYLTGKSKVPVHPKHLISKNYPQYLKYIKNGDIVLDLGCHQGEISLALTRKAQKVIAVDYDKKALGWGIVEQKRRKIKNISFSEVNLEKNLPFKNNQFNPVFFLDVLEHLNNRDQVLNEIYRVLKEDGRLILAVPNKETSWKKIQKRAGIFYYSDPDHKIEFTMSEIEKLIKNHRFHIDNIEPNAYDTPLNPLIDLAGGISLTLYKRLRKWKSNMLKKYPLEGGGFLIIATKKNP